MAPKPVNTLTPNHDSLGTGTVCLRVEVVPPHLLDASQRVCSTWDWPRALKLVRMQPDLLPLQADHQLGNGVARAPTFRMPLLQDWGNLSGGIDAVISKADKQRLRDAVALGDESPALKRRGSEFCCAGLNLQT